MCGDHQAVSWHPFGPQDGQSGFIVTPSGKKALGISEYPSTGKPVVFVGCRFATTRRLGVLKNQKTYLCFPRISSPFCFFGGPHCFPQTMFFFLCVCVCVAGVLTPATCVESERGQVAEPTATGDFVDRGIEGLVSHLKARKSGSAWGLRVRSVCICQQMPGMDTSCSN